jgi:hypothetical protein
MKRSAAGRGLQGSAAQAWWIYRARGPLLRSVVATSSPAVRSLGPRSRTQLRRDFQQSLLGPASHPAKASRLSETRRNSRTAPPLVPPVTPPVFEPSCSPADSDHANRDSRKVTHRGVSSRATVRAYDYRPPCDEAGQPRLAADGNPRCARLPQLKPATLGGRKEQRHARAATVGTFRRCAHPVTRGSSLHEIVEPRAGGPGGRHQRSLSRVVAERRAGLPSSCRLA